MDDTRSTGAGRPIFGTGIRSPACSKETVHLAARTGNWSRGSSPVGETRPRISGLDSQPAGSRTVPAHRWQQPSGGVPPRPTTPNRPQPAACATGETIRRSHVQCGGRDANVDALDPAEGPTAGQTPLPGAAAKGIVRPTGCRVSRSDRRTSLMLMLTMGSIPVTRSADKVSPGPSASRVARVEFGR
jgi:hypothetical protein